MINTLLVCDNADSSLGIFFDKCGIRTKEIFSIKNDIDIEEIYSNTLNEVNVELKTNKLNNKPFIFISYSHGSEVELLKDGTFPFISDKINPDCLTNAFAYCFACDTGKILGKNICKNGTLCFIGYDKKVIVQSFFNVEDFFLDCAVAGLESFVNGRTTGELYSDMKEIYNLSINKTYKIDFLSAALLMQNRDALVIHGETNLKYNDFKNK